MTITLDTTIGGAGTNSYTTVADATTYLEARLNSSAWTGTEPQKAALVEAFRELNLRAYEGTPVTATQAGQWPRQWAVNPDSPTLDWYGTTTIPQRVKDAQCELALEFLRAGTTDVAALPSTDGVIEKTVDVLTTRWAEPYAQAKGLARYPRVLALLRPLFAWQGGSAPVVRG